MILHLKNAIWLFIMCAFPVFPLANAHVFVFTMVYGFEVTVLLRINNKVMILKSRDFRKFAF